MLGWPEGHPLHQQAKAILDEKNINEVIHFLVTTTTYSMPHAPAVFAQHVWQMQSVGPS